MDPTRLLLFIAFIFGLFNIFLFITDDNSIDDRLTLQDLEQDTGFIHIAAGNDHACGLSAGGRIWCWGNGTSGQLGNGRFSSSQTPVPVTALPLPAIAVDVNASTSCAILEDGTTWCWGSSASGQINLPFATPATAFPVLINENPAHLISVGHAKVCSTKQQGGLFCWGEVLSQDPKGRVFMTNPGVFTSLTQNRFYLDVDSGADHACALSTDEDVTCWGNTDDGAAGPNATNFSRWAIVEQPQKINLTTTAALLATGNNHSCVVDTLNSLWCWGNSRGYSPREGVVSSPTKVADITTPVALAAGNDFTCFTDDKLTYCIGQDNVAPWLAFPATIPPMTQLDASGEQLCGLSVNGGGWCVNTQGTLNVAGLRPTDWRPDNSFGARWSRAVGFWATQQIKQEQQN